MNVPRIIVDYLLAAGEQVFHIRGPSEVEDARLILGAVARDDGTITYRRCYSTANRNPQRGDGPNHGRTVTAEPNGDSAAKLAPEWT